MFNKIKTMVRLIKYHLIYMLFFIPNVKSFTKSD